MHSESTIAPVLHKFVVYAPDKAEEGTLERRMSARAQHLENARPLVSAGIIKVAGAMLTPESIEGETSTKKMIGSMIIMEAENMETVRKLIENDIYYTTGVWDPEKLVIVPFLAALPFP